MFRNLSALVLLVVLVVGKFQCKYSTNFRLKKIIDNLFTKNKNNSYESIKDYPSHGFEFTERSIL